MVRPMGLEPMTCRLKVGCSTTELRAQKWAPFDLREPEEDIIRVQPRDLGHYAIRVGWDFYRVPQNCSPFGICITPLVYRL